MKEQIEKQAIEEMAKFIKESCAKTPCFQDEKPYTDCDVCAAIYLYSAGYRKQSEWISVDERLPEKETAYLCRCVIRDNIDFPFFMVLRYILIDEKTHFQHECDDGLSVTHWMPIPEPPNMKEGAE